MHNKIWKILAVFILLFSMAKRVWASTLVENKVDNVYYSRVGGIDGYVSFPFYEYSIDGLTTYCIEPGVRITSQEYIGDGNLVNSPYSDEINDKIQLIGYYGYDYPGHESVEYRMAAQALIWETVDDVKVTFYTKQYDEGDIINIDDEKKEILDLVNNHYTVPSFAGSGTIYDYWIYENKIDLYDNNKVLDSFEILDNPFNFEIENNHLKNKTISTKFKKVTLTKKSYTNNPTQLFVGKDKVTQKMAYFGLNKTLQVDVNFNVRGGNVEVTKLDKDTLGVNAKGDSKLLNSLYKVYKEDGTEVADITIDKFGYGMGYYNLDYGKYYLQEYKAGEGYTVDKTKYYFEITESNMVVKMTLYDKAIERKLELYKVLAASKTGFLQGEANVSFDIYLKSKMEKVATITTDEKGYASITLPYGTYIIKQVNSKDGYEKVDDFEIEVLEESDEAIVKILADAPISAKVKINKIDALTKEKIPFDGIKFKIKNLDTDTYVCQKVNYPSNEEICVFETKNGSFITPEPLKMGHYELEEVEDIIKGYLWNKEKLQFTLTKDSDYIKENDELLLEINFENEPIFGQIKITKYGEKVNYYKESFGYSYYLLNNVEFSLYAYDDIYRGDGTLVYKKDALVGKYLTKDGKIVIDNLYLGKYYLMETSCLSGYITNNHKEIIDLVNTKENEAVVIKEYTFYNYLKTGRLELLKVDEDTNMPLANTSIAIYDNSNNKIIYKGTTNNEGKISLNNLYLGKFYIIELKAPEGYVLNSTKIYFNIRKDQEKISITMDNHIIKGNLHFIKKDKDTNKVISNTLVAIYDEFNNLIQKEYTDEFGSITIKDLKYGKYYIKELEASEGYILNEEIIPFEIRNDNETIEIEMTNEMIKGKLYINKKDKNTNEIIKNTLIDIYDELDHLIYEGFTDEYGMIILDDILYGNYYIIERKAAEGYILNDEKINFTIKENGQIIEIEMFNEKEPIIKDEFIVPQTFSNDNYLYLIIISISLLLGINCIKYGKKNKY